MEIKATLVKTSLGGVIDFDFGKNGMGITDELVKIGKRIQKLSKDNHVYLSSESWIDTADDVYTLKFAVIPKKEETTKSEQYAK
jgi:hypothetical protein